MLKRDHIKTKLIAFIALNALACFVFVINTPERGYGPSFVDYGFGEAVVLYPLLSIIYGALVWLTAFRDPLYIGIMSVTFLSLGAVNVALYGIIEILAVFVYAVIAAASALVAMLVAALVTALRHSWREYTVKRTTHKE